MNDFKHKSITDFDLTSESGRRACLAYIKQWHAFVVEKAKGCTSALQKCTAGVSNLETNADGKSVEVSYEKYESGKKVTGKCTVAPSVNYCITKIVSDKPQSGNDADEGRTYTITYGKPEKTYDLMLQRGDRGNDGSPGAWGGVYFKNGMKAIDWSATGFSASAKVIKPSVTGVSGGATAFSLSACLYGIKTGIIYRCRTGIGFKSDVAGNVCHFQSARAAANRAKVALGMADATARISAIANVENRTVGLRNQLAGIANAAGGLRSELNKIGLNVNT